MWAVCSIEANTLQGANRFYHYHQNQNKSIPRMRNAHSIKVLVKLFQKFAGYGAAPHGFTPQNRLHMPEPFFMLYLHHKPLNNGGPYAQNKNTGNPRPGYQRRRNNQAND